MLVECPHCCKEFHIEDGREGREEQITEMMVREVLFGETVKEMSHLMGLGMNSVRTRILQWCKVREPHLFTPEYADEMHLKGTPWAYPPGIREMRKRIVAFFPDECDEVIRNEKWYESRKLNRFEQRNIDITDRMLEGASVKSIARVHALSVKRVLQTFHVGCRRRNRRRYKEIRRIAQTDQTGKIGSFEDLLINSRGSFMSTRLR